MSSTEKLERQGRAIAALRSQWLYLGHWPRTRKTPRFPDEEIRDLLGLSKAGFDLALEAWLAISRPPRWNTVMMQSKILAFAKREKRWPTSADLDKWRENDLFARSTAAGHGENIHTLIQSLVDLDSAFSKFNRQLILTIPNITTRRQAMVKYGIDKLVKAGQLLHQDDYGKLWRLPTDNQTDAHAQYLEVTNSTPEEDGTFAHYFLRVPPEMETAKEAAAWTFQREELEIEAAT